MMPLLGQFLLTSDVPKACPAPTFLATADGVIE
jgi:hypothetical protein